MILLKCTTKCISYLKIWINFLTYRKQRRSNFCFTVIVTFVIFPYTFFVILISSLISSFLLPIFTLPLLIFPSFPRTRKCWITLPSPTVNDTVDKLIYKSMLKNISKLLNESMETGKLGLCNSGSIFLLRNQDRILWVSIEEEGYSYKSILIKGLELQETSCHTIEAAFLDDNFESFFKNFSIKNYLLPSKSVFKIVHKGKIEAYSDSKNRLTGVIDSPDYLDIYKANLPKIFLWIITRRFRNSDDLTKNLSNIKPDFNYTFNEDWIKIIRNDKNDWLFTDDNLHKFSYILKRILLKEGIKLLISINNILRIIVKVLTTVLIAEEYLNIHHIFKLYKGFNEEYLNELLKEITQLTIRY